MYIDKSSYQAIYPTYPWVTFNDLASLVGMVYDVTLKEELHNQ